MNFIWASRCPLTAGELRRLEEPGPKEWLQPRAHTARRAEELQSILEYEYGVPMRVDYYRPKPRYYFWLGAGD